MQYQPAPDIQKKMVDIVNKLEMSHIDVSRVSCIRSQGSQARRVVARVHGFDKAMQVGIGMKPHYVIEFLELFEKCDEQEQIETIIHELLHIPKNFGGGFRHHDYVQNRRVKQLYKKYMKEEKTTNYELFPKLRFR